MQQYRMLRPLLAALSITLGGGIAHYYFSAQTRAPIYEYDDIRDGEQVKKIFKDDWYWMSNRDWDIDQLNFVLRSHSPNEYEPRYFGKMTIKVLREQDNVVGFITYYMLNFYEGKILFLAINPEFRGQKQADKLLKVAVDDLFAQGATLVRLVTRIDNVSAQKLYKRFGFEQVPPWDDEGFVHFVITKK